MRRELFRGVAVLVFLSSLILGAGCDVGGGVVGGGVVGGPGYSSGSCTAGSFTVVFTGGNFVTGLGWSTGSTSRTIDWSGTCSGCDWGPGVYGWMQNPLVEYYIPRTASGINRGTYLADGGTTYTLVTHTQVSQPSIVGTATFEQYFAQGGTGGPVDFGEHVTGWQSRGLPIGTDQNYQVVAVESWSGGTGSADVTVTNSNWYTHWVGSGSAVFTCGD